jgi:hypothetical protein
MGFRPKEEFVRATPLTVVILIVVSLMAVGRSSAGEISISEEPVRNDLILPDLLVVRPLCAAAATMTTALFLVALPATYPLGKDHDAIDLVEKPWWCVSDRPLGVFQSENLAQGMNKEINNQYPEILKRSFVDGPLKEIR